MRSDGFALFGFLIAAAGAAQSFAPSCQTPGYPQPAPSQALGIDAQCGITGSGTGAEATQDAQKNNFCASGTAQEVTIQDLTALQQQVVQNPAINFGDENQPDRKKGPTTDRSLLAALGEGKLVALKGYILVARQEGAESVNCGSGVPNEALYHDIHISVVGSADETVECSGVVVEMSPHHRPDPWNHANVDKVAKAHALVRVTGQLYFDSSHMPCSGGQPVRSNPKRVSLWEVHPVYGFEVCISDCDGAGQWLPLDLWVQQQS
jgi:hypothetical protein